MNVVFGYCEETVGRLEVPAEVLWPGLNAPQSVNVVCRQYNDIMCYLHWGIFHETFNNGILGYLISKTSINTMSVLIPCHVMKKL